MRGLEGVFHRMEWLGEKGEWTNGTDGTNEADETDGTDGAKELRGRIGRVADRDGRRSGNEWRRQSCLVFRLFRHFWVVFEWN